MSQSSTTAEPPPLGRRYNVGGRRLWLHRAGSGGPAVVFLPGAGLIGLDYLNVHEDAARLTTSVIYDRAGTGWSEPIALPRSAADVAEELRRLLQAADVPPPYVLVGKSLGGAYARRFAQLFPGEVAGVVLLDPAHEGYASMPGQPLLTQLRQAVKLLPALINLRRFYRPMFEKMLATWPDGLRERLVDYHLANWSKTLQEARNLQGEILAEIRDGGAMPDAPLIVLTAIGIDPFQAALISTPYLRELNVRKLAFYDAFAASAPRGENRAIKDAGHNTLHPDRPDAVLLAIHDVVDAARVSAPAVYRDRTRTGLSAGSGPTSQIASRSSIAAPPLPADLTRRATHGGRRGGSGRPRGREMAKALDHRDQRVDQGAPPASRGRRSIAELAPGRRGQDRLLVREVLVERADADAGAFRDFARVEGPGAVPFENLSRRLDNGRPGGPRARLPRATALIP